MRFRLFAHFFLIFSLSVIAACGGGTTDVPQPNTNIDPYTLAPTVPASPGTSGTPPLTLSPVLGLQVTEDPNVNGTLRLTWQPVANALSYEVVWNGMILNADTESYSFIGLKDGTTHTFTVRAKNGTVFGQPASVTKTVGLLGTITITGTLPYAITGSTVTAYWNGNVVMGSTTSNAGAYTLNVNLTRNVNLAPATIVVKSVGGTGAGLSPATAPTFIALLGKIDPATAIPASLSGNMDEATTVLYGYLTYLNGNHLPQTDAAFYQSWLDTNVLLGKPSFESDLLGMITLYASYMNKNIPTAWAIRDLPIFASGMSNESNSLLSIYNYVKIVGAVPSLDSAVTSGTPAFAPDVVLTPAVVSALPPTDVAFSFAGASQLRLSNLRQPGSFIDKGGIPNLASPQVTLTVGDGSLTATWAGVIGATSYNVYLDNTLVGNVTQSPYSFTGLVNGKLYSVSVTSVGLAGESSIRYVNGTPTPVPSVPTGLTAAYDNATQAITLNWNAAVGATSYDVKLNGVLVASGQQQTSYTYGGAVIGTTYIFDVIAVNASGQSLPATTTIVP